MISNKQNTIIWIFTLPIILALTSIGCGLSGVVANLRSSQEPTPTRTPMPTFTPTPAGSSFVEDLLSTPQSEADQPQEPPPTEVEVQPSAEVTEPEPTEPPSTPTSEPTATPPPTSDTVTVTILQNMNVRTGPGTNYTIAGPGPAGESSNVVGRNADSSWLQVEYPLTADGTGWIYAPLVQVNGNPEIVPVVQVAPPEPVAAEPPPQEEAPPPAPEPPKYQFTPTGWHASHNAAIVHFKGRIRDESGNLVNGFSVLVNNGSWSVLAHPTGASHHYPDKGDGEWDVVIPDLKDGIGWWTLAVASYDCPNFTAGFDAQCKQYTILSEEIPVEVIYPDETIINADWVCHWDCDKGLYTQSFRR